MSPSEVLKEYWGYDGFRPMQEEIITAALEGKDVLAGTCLRPQVLGQPAPLPTGSEAAGFLGAPPQARTS